jgi:hypothetical protein
MNTGFHIRYVQRQEIDFAKWDQCIETASNGLIYARAFYLDHMSSQWDALVYGDYEAVMPLTWNRKWGIKYLYQPPFTQQLGIFSAKELTGALTDAFLHLLRRHFRFAEIFLNYNNNSSLLRTYTNFILPLNAPYNQLCSNYKKTLVSDLKQAAGHSLHYIKDYDLHSTLLQYKDWYQDRTPHLKEDAYRRFEKLCFFLQDRGQILVRAITDQRQQLLATALLPQYKGRIYLLQSTCLPAGRRAKANHLLIDSIIREFAGQSMILDFEGSELPGIARFYRNFGGQNQPYFYYRYNQLPWPIRWLK